jgi:hypothetical protein
VAGCDDGAEDGGVDVRHLADEAELRGVGEGRAVRRRASLPQRLTAVAPARQTRETRCLLTFPASTISTTSMVDASEAAGPRRGEGRGADSVQGRVREGY